MSEAPDPLEAELSALRPHEVSPGLRRRVAERLAEAPPAQRLRWRLALAGGLAAACLVVVLFRWAAGPRVAPERTAIRPQPVAVELKDSLPTLLAYQRALARSPEELEASLDKDAVVTPEPNPECARVGAFSWSDVELHTLLGED